MSVRRQETTVNPDATRSDPEGARGQPRARLSPGGTSWSPLTSSAFAAIDARTRCTPLPLPSLFAPADRASTHYAVTAIDDRGRLSDTSAVSVLGWLPGLCLGFSVLPGATGVVVERGGHAILNGRGRLLLPVPVRRALYLERGDRVLLAAHPDRDLLIAYTRNAIEAMTSWLHASLASGAAA
jgi:hypothetical protein